MSPVVILCRHGNTFEKGEKVVMVGANEDLPLTAHGVEQGRAVGRALKVVGVIPDRIISGPLKRTKVFAEEVKTVTASPAVISIDPRLIEFDYGAWSGLSNEEIVTRSGHDALMRWQEESVRPLGITFTPSEDDARSEALEFLRDLESGSQCALVVTSNGRLRELGMVLVSTHAGGPKSFKVKTGHACVVVREESAWKVIGWDLSPEELQQKLL